MGSRLGPAIVWPLQGFLNPRRRDNAQWPETTTLSTCLRAIWSGTSRETLEVIKHSLPHWTILIKGSV